MKQILTVLIILLIVKLSFGQNSSTEKQLRWGNDTTITLIFLKYLPENGDTIMGLKFFELEELENKVVGLLKHKEKSEEKILRQDTVIRALNIKLDATDKQLNNLKQQNKNTRKTWLKRGVGLSVGGLSLGLAVGLILPIILD